MRKNAAPAVLNACFMIMERTSPSWVVLSRDGEMGRDPVLPSKASLPTGEQMLGVKGAGSPEKPVVAGVFCLPLISSKPDRPSNCFSGVHFKKVDFLR